MVDELVTLVAMVLIPAAKIEAISRPVNPTGNSIDYKERKDIIRPSPVGQDPGCTFIERIQPGPYHKEDSRNGNKQISSEQGRELSLLLILRRMITLHITLVYTIVLQISKYAIKSGTPKKWTHLNCFQNFPS